VRLDTHRPADWSGEQRRRCTTRGLALDCERDPTGRRTLGGGGAWPQPAPPGCCSRQDEPRASLLSI